jgi:hypothetical protein
MDRRQFLQSSVPLFVSAATLAQAGCRNVRHAHVLSDDHPDMVGSHTAGAETWKPLIDESVSRLLGRQLAQIQQAGYPAARKRIVFCGVENRSSEEIGDFREQIYEEIDTLISSSEMFEPVSRRYVEAGLQQCGLRGDQLFLPNNQRMFAAVMEEMQQPFDYLLYAKITSGTTQANHDYQRDYLLTLELVNIHDGSYDKDSAELRKGYHRSALGPFTRYRWKPWLTGRS